VMLFAKAVCASKTPSSAAFWGVIAVGWYSLLSCADPWHMATWSPHINQVRRKAAQKQGRLGSLLNRRCGFSVWNGVLLYKQSGTFRLWWLRFSHDFYSVVTRMQGYNVQTVHGLHHPSRMVGSSKCLPTVVCLRL
jgi:hypothetical protein